MQIAVITACISIVIILAIGAALLYCCVNEKRSREHRLKGVNRIRHHSGNKYYRPKFQYTLDRNSMSSWIAPKQSSDRRRKPSSSENHAPLNLQERYAKRPYMLPSVVQSPTNVWSATQQTPFTTPPGQNGTGDSNTFSSNFYAYNVARPSNRSKDSYVKYQRKFKK